MANLRTTLRVLQGVRQLSTSAAKQAGEVHPGYARIKDIQKQFQKPDGLPVHLKGGAMDKILFGVTVALIGVGTVMFGDLLISLSYPKKQD